ncbi:MAG TPA: HAD family phosphatase [Bacteroidales bacterium]|nr:HAD family phosphatase [Bacteroidales bacterium]HRX96969.1 HAD family phosphatase [Bacteroidales bacterium]
MEGSEPGIPDIKNIIFDFGGVIINIHHERVENAFKAIGVKDFERLFNQASQSDLFQKLEKGEISEQEFRDEIRDITGLNINDEDLDHTWNQIIGEYPPHRIDLLKNLRSNYRLFLLSNTNSIHFRYYISMFQDQFGFAFESLFDGAYWSFQFGMRKPDPDPYLHLLKQENLQPGETLFIDDSVQNIHAARKLNILALHLNDQQDISTLFKNALLIPELVKSMI